MDDLMIHQLPIRFPLAAILFLTFGATFANAQITRPDYSNNPEILAYSAGLIRADKARLKASQLLDRGDDAGAEREAERSLIMLETLYSETGRWGSCIAAQLILAEVYAHQGRFAAALKMCEERSHGWEGFLNARELAIKAVALANLGSLDEARACVGKALTMDNVVVSLLGDRADLPAAHDSSAAALVATAWLVHACETKMDDRALPRAQKGFEAAQRLASRNPVVALNLARFYRETLHRPDLAQKALARAFGGTKATRELIAVERVQINDAIKRSTAPEAVRGAALAVGRAASHLPPLKP